MDSNNWQPSQVDPEMMLQSQQTPPEAAPSNSTAQTGSTEAQKEVYQKIKVMKELYFTEVEDVYQRIYLKLQQKDSVPQQHKSEYFKKMLERILNCLQLSRMDALQVTKDRVARLQQQIISIVSSHRPRNQQPHSQIPQTQSHESGGQLQNVQGSLVPSLQPGSNLEPEHGS